LAPIASLLCFTRLASLNSLCRRALLCRTFIVEPALATEAAAAIIPPTVFDPPWTLALGEAGMHTVDLLDEALAAARQAGFRIGEEWRGGEGGGSCLLKGQKWIFVDLALDTAERLDLVTAALSTDPAAVQLALSDALRSRITIRKSA